MNIVLATGCPNSGWEVVIPTLQNAGLNLAGESFGRWHDELYMDSEIDDFLSIKNPPFVDKQKRKNLSALLKKESSESLLLADSRDLWILDFWSSQFPQAKFLLFFTHPVTALVYAVLHGLDPQEFLNRWKLATQRLIVFQAHHRERAILLDAESATQVPKKLIEICKSIELNLLNSPQWPTPEKKDLPALERLIVANLATTKPILDHYSELVARAHPLRNVESHTWLQPEQLINSYKELKNTLNVSLNRAEDENKLLLMQIYQVQEELENQYLGNQLIRRENEQLLQLKHKLQTKEQVIENYKQYQEKIMDQMWWKIISIFHSVLIYFKRLNKGRDIREKIKLLIQSDLFDQQWYLANNPDVANAGCDPVEHYIEKGGFENRNPSPLFDSKYYFAKYPDVSEKGVNPLVHYIKYGKKEGRKISNKYE